MKTKELIKLLKKYDPNSTVSIVFTHNEDTVLDVLVDVCDNAGPQLNTLSFVSAILPSPTQVKRKKKALRGKV